MTSPAPAPGAVGQRVKARARKLFPVDLADALRLDDGPAPALVQIAQSGEDDDAMVAGHAHVEKATASLGAETAAAARADGRMLPDATSKAALALAFRDAADPSRPLFPDADFLRDHLSTDEVATLSNIVAEFRRVAARVPVPDDAVIERLLDLVFKLADQDHEAPGVVLAPYSEVVTYILVEVALKLRAARLVLAEHASAAAAVLATLHGAGSGAAGDETVAPSEPAEPPSEPAADEDEGAP
jgi:hypothetical protein